MNSYFKYLISVNSADSPKLKTDIYFADRENEYEYNGFLEKSIRFVEKNQLLNATLWKRFVNQFCEDADSDAGWRGEYWGKMMRGACFVYSYTKNDELYDVLLQTVCDMLDVQGSDGRISSYSVSHEFDGWDIWGRKYVLLGMQYFLEISKDEMLNKKIIASMCRQVDYIIEKIGDGEGKKPITSATRHWRGVNSSSILEPIVRLYNITKEKKYLDFATYIVNTGGADIVNIFELAFKNELYPYQYPVTKAYEMTSCFEGLLEYYRITEVEKYKTAIINFADRILETDFTVIGCCGCTHELFDHSTVRQANTTNGKNMQETCVTVTLMKFFYQLTLLTGNPKYVDAFERSLYNAYLGSVNTENISKPSILLEDPNAEKLVYLTEKYPELVIEPLTFDSYSPLTAATRGTGVGGLKVMSDNHYYGCCACIGALGVGLIPKIQLLTSKEGFVFNLFINGTVTTKTPQNNRITFQTDTEYPKNGKISTKIHLENIEEFEISIRIPEWSHKNKIYVNSSSIEVENGYTSIKRIWSDGDIIEIELDMRTEAIYPIPYGTQILMNTVIWGHNCVIPTYDKEDELAKKHVALRRGPIMLAHENRLGYDIMEPIDIEVNEAGYVDVTLTDENIPYDYIVAVNVPLKNGKKIMLTDYSSAGKLWNEESKMAVWMVTD